MSKSKNVISNNTGVNATLLYQIELEKNESKNSIAQDMVIDGNVFQAFNDKHRINFSLCESIELQEYSQPSNNIYKFSYLFNMTSGKSISSPNFGTKELLDNWLQGIKDNG